MTKVAIVVVHGIGKQGRYQTLDKFVRGFESALPRKDLKVNPQRIAFAGSGAHNFVSITASDAPLMIESSAKEVDCYEAYWQSQVRGLARARGVAMWLANAAMAPLRLWAQVDVHQRSVLGRIERMLAEFGRLLLFPFVVLLSAIGIYAANSNWGGTGDVEANPWRAIAAVAEFVGLVAFVLMLFGGVWKGLLGPWARLGAPPVSKSEKWWGWASLFFVSVLIAIAGGLHTFAGWTPYIISDELRPLAISAVLALLGLYLALLLTDIVGDAAVYLTDDPDSKGTLARSEIRGSVQNLITELAGRYEAVHVVAHSLGSVIALDALNKLRVIARGTADGDSELLMRHGLKPDEHDLPVSGDAMVAEAAYKKVRTFITLASPLDHVAYYFRTKVAQDRTFRRDILHFRHGLRLRPTEVTKGADGNYAGKPDFIPGPRGLYWLNIHGVGDPIGQELKSYKVDQQERVGTFADYFPPLAAHEAMWKNPDVYKLIVERLAYPTVRQAQRAGRVEA